MTEEKPDYFAEADRSLAAKLRETAEFLLPLNKKLAERTAQAEHDFASGRKEVSLEALRELFYGPGGIDSVFVSHIVKREKLEDLKRDLRAIFLKLEKAQNIGRTS